MHNVKYLFGHCLSIAILALIHLIMWGELPMYYLGMNILFLWIFPIVLLEFKTSHLKDLLAAGFVLLVILAVCLLPQSMYFYLHTGESLSRTIVGGYGVDDLFVNTWVIIPTIYYHWPTSVSVIDSFLVLKEVESYFVALLSALFCGYFFLTYLEKPVRNLLAAIIVFSLMHISHYMVLTVTFLILFFSTCVMLSFFQSIEFWKKGKRKCFFALLLVNFIFIFMTTNNLTFQKRILSNLNDFARKEYIEHFYEDELASDHNDGAIYLNSRYFYNARRHQKFSFNPWKIRLEKEGMSRLSRISDTLNNFINNIPPLIGIGDKSMNPERPMWYSGHSFLLDHYVSFGVLLGTFALAFTFIIPGFVVLGAWWTTPLQITMPLTLLWLAHFLVSSFGIFGVRPIHVGISIYFAVVSLNILRPYLKQSKFFSFFNKIYSQT